MRMKVVGKRTPSPPIPTGGSHLTFAMETKCEPPEVTNSRAQQELGTSFVGGFVEQTDIAAMAPTLKPLIEKSLNVYRIYKDYKDVIIINKVYTQVVNGINYLINFDILPTGGTYWLRISDRGQAGTFVDQLIPCSTPVVSKTLMESTTSPFYSLGRKLFGQ